MFHEISSNSKLVYYKMRESGGSSELFNSDSIKCTVRISLYQRSSSWDSDANNAWPPVFANTGLGGMIIGINHETRLKIIMITNWKINTTTWPFTAPVSQIRKLLDNSLHNVPYIFNTNDLNLCNNSLIFIMKTDIIFISLLYKNKLMLLIVGMCFITEDNIFLVSAWICKKMSNNNLHIHRSDWVAFLHITLFWNFKREYFTFYSNYYLFHFKWIWFLIKADININKYNYIHF